jgi:hypothetical protein
MPLSQAQINAGAFLPTTNIWDTAEIEDIDVRSEEFKELLIKLYRNINNIALSVNIRDAGFYPQTEFINGQLFFPNPALSSQTPQVPTQRQVFRKVVNFGALPNSSTKNFLHEIDINDKFTFTRIYGAASDTTGFTYIPLPYVSTGAASIELSVSQTNVIVTTATNRSNFNSTYIILEYIKN